MVDFKGFLDAAAEGKQTNVLFVVANARARDALIVAMFDAASNRGLCPIMRTMGWQMLIGDAVATLRIAHDRLDEQMRGMRFTSLSVDELADLDPTVLCNLTSRVHADVFP